MSIYDHIKIVSITAKKDGIHANDNITVNGGAVNIKEAEEGIESKNDIVINSGSVTVLASDDGLNAATDITINEGSVYSKSTRGDAIDSNGTINIKGGTIVAVGGSQPECGIDSDNNNLSITGGTLIAAGGSNSMPTASSTTQSTVMLGVTSENGIIHIEGDGGEVLTYKAEQNAQSIVFSSPKLALGKTYTIYTDGNINGGTDFNGLFTDAEYSDGTKGDSFTTSSTVTIQGGNTGMGGGRMPGMGGGGRRPGNGQNMPPDGISPPSAVK